MTGEVPEQIVVSGKSGRPGSEEVTFLGPDEYQSNRHPARFAPFETLTPNYRSFLAAVHSFHAELALQFPLFSG